MNEPPSREAILLAETLALSAGQRAAYLDNACGADFELRRAVQVLLDVSEEARGFLETSAKGGRLSSAMANPLLAAAEATVRAQKPGDRIGRYRLLEQIGEGGCGVVFMAEQEEPVRRRVAIKIIKLGMDTKEVVVRFEAERQALAMMDHPNIAKVLDAGSTETGRPYFVMELVRGIKITDYCDHNNLTTKERIDLFLQLSRAVQHAHQKGIIHRDIKPSNILVTLHDGVPVPKVIDFGIAKATQGRLTDQTLFTAFHQFIGTPAYMSPEQAEISGLDIDTRTDIYSLGILLYELLTGRTPFDGRTLLAVGLDAMRRTIREQEPERPSARLSTMPAGELTATARHRRTEPPKLVNSIQGDLDWIVMKCLEKDRTRRYETANGLATDIQRHLSNEPVVACPPSAAYRFQKAWQRNKLAMSVGAAFAALLIIATGISSWQALRASRAEALAARRLVQSGQARAEAEAISKFLSEVFQRSDPSKGERTVTVAESLNAAAEKLETEQSIPPARRSRLQAVIGTTYHSLGLCREAIVLQEKVVAYNRNTHGQENPDTLEAMGNLALSFSAAGRREEALKLQDEVLASSRKVLGPEHPETLTAMNNLALSYYDAGRRNEALKLREEVLRLCRKVHGPEHLATLSAMHNLALSYSDAGRLEEALKLREEVLSLRRKVLGPSHPDTLGAMLNLAGSYSDAGRREEALKLHEEVLSLRRKVLGPEHPNTLIAMNNLAASCYDAGRRKEALRLREEALSLSRKVNGPDHPHTLIAMHSLASSFSDAGRREEALKLEEEVLSLRRKVLGPEHPDTLVAMNDLAIYYYSDAGRRQEALKLWEIVLPLFLKMRGAEYPDTLMVMHNLAKSYRDAGRREEAIKLQEELLTLRRDVNGPDHRDTLAVMRDLANAYTAGQNYAKAEPLLSDLLARARKSAGTNSSELESRLSDMAELRYRQQRYAEAEALHRERIENRLRRPGGETSDSVLHSRASLGRLYSDWAWGGRATNGAAAHERAIEAEKLIRETIAVREGDAKFQAWRKADLQSRLGGALTVVACTDPGLTPSTRELKLVEAEVALQRGQTRMEEDKNTETKYLRHGIERFIRLYEVWLKPDKLDEWKRKLATFDETNVYKSNPDQP